MPIPKTNIEIITIFTLVLKFFFEGQTIFPASFFNEETKDSFSFPSCFSCTISVILFPYLNECEGPRTPDLRLWRPLLYQLSYTPKRRFSPPFHYEIIFETVPAPIVRPPSRIAKRIPSSIATGEISSPVISALSPGITISVPSTRVTVPVTSVVLK